MMTGLLTPCLLSQVMGLLPISRDVLKSSGLEDLTKTKLLAHQMKVIRQAAGKDARPATTSQSAHLH